MNFYLLGQEETIRFSWRGVIFTAEYPHTHPYKAHHFTPTKKEVIKAEKLIKDFYKELSNDTINSDFERMYKIGYNKFRFFKRQYIGYYNDNGDKVILIHFVRPRKLRHFLIWQKRIYNGAG